MWFRAFAITCAIFTSVALAVTPADKAALQGQATLVIQDAAKVTLDATALKAMIDLLPLDVVPPVATWPRIKPDMLDVDLIDQDTLLKAKWLDGTTGWDGLGTALHYGDMAGAIDAWQPFTIPAKLSNASCPPKWGVESNGLHFLESCTDGNKQVTVCDSCRMINWNYSRFSVREIYWRSMGYYYPETLANTIELGIKMSGVGGAQANGGAFAEIFELGKKTATGFPLQAYRYDGEGDQGVTVFPGIEIKPSRWYTYEGHVKAASCGVCSDGVMEFKVDGVLVFSRRDVKMGAIAITGFGVQWYHGGVTKPAGILRVKTARIAMSKAGWIGPAPEVN